MSPGSMRACSYSQKQSHLCPWVRRFSSLGIITEFKPACNLHQFHHSPDSTTAHKPSLSRSVELWSYKDTGGRFAPWQLSTAVHGGREKQTAPSSPPLPLPSLAQRSPQEAKQITLYIQVPPHLRQLVKNIFLEAQTRSIYTETSFKKCPVMPGTKPD